MNKKIHFAFLREDLEWLHYKKLLAKEKVYIVSREPVDNADVCLEFVRAGLGYAVITEPGLSQEEDLWRTPIIDHMNEPMEREKWLYASKESSPYSTTQAFLQFVKNEKFFYMS